jgi:predicted CXXCH cytochrome family protein
MSGLKNLRHPSIARRIAIACALLAVLLLWPLPASGGYGWDLGMAAGYASLVCAAALYLYPLRGEGLPHRRLFTLSQHRRIGWIALTLSLVHAGVLLIAQPRIGHYLLPSAPVYMLLGTVALIALAALVATGLSARKSLRKSAVPRTSQTIASAPPRAARNSGPSPTHPTPWTIPTHAILAGLLLACLGAHIVGSGQLADHPGKVITLCLLLALPLVWAAIWRKGPQSRSRLPTLLPNLAAAATLCLLPLPFALPQLLKPVAPPALLPVNFPHEKHTSVDCVLCHHNFTDKTGAGSCLDCHRSGRSDLPASAEATFHTFCRNCHSELAQATDKHGPARACSDCHMKTPLKGTAPPLGSG